jgi:hypothetical protein
VAQLIDAALTTSLIGWILMPTVGLWQLLESTKQPSLLFRALVAEDGSKLELVSALEKGDAA